MNPYSPKGSLWNRWDLHFHTPASYDYRDASVTAEQIVDRLIAKGVRLVAVTDHHKMDVALITAMQRLGGDRLTVLPGIELRSELGGTQSVHFIGLFSEEQDVAELWKKLSVKLEITEDTVSKNGDENIYCKYEEIAKVIHAHGGIVSVHAGTKANSIEGLKNSDAIKQVVKKDLVRNHIDIYELGKISDEAAYKEIVFPHLDRPIPLICCSDNHKIAEYEAPPLWVRADPAFRGLLMVLREPDRVFLGARPAQLVRVEQNPTKYVRSISFARKDGAPDAEKWFSGSIEFNPGLIAVIGNKGSGKSALVDTLGLLGATKNAGSFSFLSGSRFRHPVTNLAQYFEATIKWESPEEVTRALTDEVPTTEPERVKYLPQDHVEKVCNELAGTGEAGFEKELKSVIFSHVPEAQRLGQHSLDELVVFKTEEKQKRIDALVRQLKEHSRIRAALEAQANPDVATELEEKIKQCESELKAHDAAQPSEKQDPKSVAGAGAPSPELLSAVDVAQKTKSAIEAEITQIEGVLRVEERKLAVAKRLIEKIDNFAKEFDVFKGGLVNDATELGLKTDELVSLKIDKTAVTQLRDTAVLAVAETKKKLAPAPATDSLRTKLQTASQTLVEAQAKLDGPNREYQAYLQELETWKTKRAKIVGNETQPDSLVGLQTALAALKDVPAKISAERESQVKIALEIHLEKLAQAEVYRGLYQPVQEFIDSHPLAKDKLKLEFRAELMSEDFPSKLLALINQNRVGAFMGVDAGFARAQGFVDTTKWDDKESIEAFLRNVDGALHNDEGKVIQLHGQLLKNKRPDEVFDLLYGIEYVKPRYILRWDGKDLSMLSPGERGTLLLVFYLLIDNGEMPLVIDQPEGNLDNHTVAKVLVDCIKTARERRQVFIVTHNPNLAVVCDADQIVHASMDKKSGNAITYTTGALENPKMTRFVTDVLEGTRQAFNIRGAKYDAGD